MEYGDGVNHQANTKMQESKDKMTYIRPNLYTNIPYSLFDTALHNVLLTSVALPKKIQMLRTIHKHIGAFNMQQLIWKNIKCSRDVKVLQENIQCIINKYMYNLHVLF